MKLNIFRLTIDSASSICNIMGLLQNSTKDFGLVNVRGRKRVPKPPTKMRAFIFQVMSKYVQSNEKSLRKKFLTTNIYS